MKKPSPFALRRAKSTLFGRFLCRLLGDQTGAVLMEYVVLGVLVVAAVVGLAIVFGEQLGDSFHEMVLAIQGKTEELQQFKEQKEAKRQERLAKKAQERAKIQNQTGAE